MRHRHLRHQDFTLAAIDDIIGNGSLEAWKRLQRALWSVPGSVRRSFGSAHRMRPILRRSDTTFWRRYASEASNFLLTGSGCSLPPRTCNGFSRTPCS